MREARKTRDLDSHHSERENPPQIVSVTRNTLTMTKERPTLEDTTNRVGKKNEAVQHGLLVPISPGKKETKIPTSDKK